MVIEQNNTSTFPSVAYTVVRSRQLESTYPGDAQTGCWPISSLRVMRGWGSVPEDAWPSSSLQSWPPLEPPGMDEIAKGTRIFRYQRIRTAQECLEAVRSKHPVTASFEITREWLDSVNGYIQLPKDTSPIIGSHMVTIIGVDRTFTIMPGNEKTVFIFDNSWGREWGVDGRGFLPWEYFPRWLIEAWSFDEMTYPQSKMRDEEYYTVPGIISSHQYVGEINDPVRDERLAWTMVTPRQDYLDVEELFVKPEYRGKGLGTKMVRSLSELSQTKGLPLRFLIPFADCETENFHVIQRSLKQINYRVEVSGVRWTPYLGLLSTNNGARPYFPEKPTLARPQLGLTSERERLSGDSPGVFDPHFQKVMEGVFNRHAELLRRLA